ncbi:MAG: hypothetical protein Q4A15_01020 [Prevotellaceae bacterium]|nr:hypothetical protein [Prevotellaceae bacterium]
MNNFIKRNKNEVIALNTRIDTFEDLFTLYVSNVLRCKNFFEGLDFYTTSEIRITEGTVGIFKNENGWQCASVTESGLPRKDGRPYKVIATWIDNGEVHVEEKINDVDIVLWYNTSSARPDSNIYHFAEMLADTDISMKYNLINSRYSPMVRVKSNAQKQQIETAYADIKVGKPLVFVEEETIESLLEDSEKDVEKEMLLNITDVRNADKLQYLTHFNSDLIRRFLTIYGYPITGTGKMAQTNDNEVLSSVSYSFGIPLDMLTQAIEFNERLKKLYNYDCEPCFGELHERLYNIYYREETGEDFSLEEDDFTGENLEENINENLEKNKGVE